MSTISIILSALMTLAIVIWIAPNILAMNRGKVLHNIALWLAIALGLALVYQNFGPGHKSLPPAAEQTEGTADTSTTGNEDGYAPPKD